MKKNEIYENHVAVNGKLRGDRKYSGNIFLCLYVLGVLIMMYVLFAPVIGEISLSTYLVESDTVLSYLVGERMDLQTNIFFYCVVFKAISLSIWLGKNI